MRRMMSLSFVPDVFIFSSLISSLKFKFKVCFALAIENCSICGLINTWERISVVRTLLIICKHVRERPSKRQLGNTGDNNRYAFNVYSARETCFETITRWGLEC